MSEVEAQLTQFYDDFNEYSEVDDYVDQLFYGFSERALHEWLKIEVEAMHTLQSWIQPVNESNCDEVANLDMCIKNVHLDEDPATQNICQGEDVEKLGCIVEKLRAKVSNESMRHVERMQVEAAYWSSLLDISKLSNHALIDFTLLKLLLPFNSDSLLGGNVGISFPHFHQPGSSKTVFTWKNNDQNQDSVHCVDYGESDSMSVFSSGRSIRGAMITEIPLVKRLSSLGKEDETQKKMIMKLTYRVEVLHMKCIHYSFVGTTWTP